MQGGVNFTDTLSQNDAEKEMFIYRALTQLVQSVQARAMDY